MAVGDKYRLHNDLGENNYIENIGENKWILRGDLGCLRINYEDVNKFGKILSIDPVGGPFMALDHFYILDDGGAKRVLASIEYETQLNEYVLIFKR